MREKGYTEVQPGRFGWLKKIWDRQYTEKKQCAFFSTTN